MKKYIKEFLVALFLIWTMSSAISYFRSPKQDTLSIPNLQGILLNNRPFVYKKNKPLVIHFWATWCPTCKLESANIERLSKAYQVLTIAVDTSEEKIKHSMHKNALHFQVLQDKEGVWAKKFHVEAFPTTFIYDAQGQLVFTEVGYMTTVGLFSRMKWLENTK